MISRARATWSLVALSAVLLLAASPATAQSSAGCQGFAGTWQSDFGTIPMSVVGNDVSGTYNGGRIQAALSGRVLQGYWVQQDRSGHLSFSLSGDGNSFAGHWTEADGSGGGAWNGRCAGGGQPTGLVAGQWLGCFRDTSALDLDGYLERSASNTPQACVARCAGLGFPYAAVQYGESCLCGSGYGRYGAANNCNYPCTGDRSQSCGGNSANAVYATGVGGTAAGGGGVGGTAAGGGGAGGSSGTASGNWTAWASNDDPGGTADWEVGKPCAATAIECRVRGDQRDWRQTGQRYKCDLTEPNPGGICINSENSGGCLDYEVRFRCP
jgi:hypothetical protein